VVFGRRRVRGCVRGCRYLENRAGSNIYIYIYIYISSIYIYIYMYIYIYIYRVYIEPHGVQKAVASGVVAVEVRCVSAVTAEGEFKRLDAEV